MSLISRQIIQDKLEPTNSSNITQQNIPDIPEEDFFLLVRVGGSYKCINYVETSNIIIRAFYTHLSL